MNNTDCDWVTAQSNCPAKPLFKRLYKEIDNDIVIFESTSPGKGQRIDSKEGVKITGPLNEKNIIVLDLKLNFGLLQAIQHYSCDESQDLMRKANAS